MSSNRWLQDFHSLIQKKSEQLAHCELDKGELEATMVLIGSRVLTLFPEDVREGDQVPDVIIRLLEELSARRQVTKESCDENV